MVEAHGDNNSWNRWWGLIVLLPSTVGVCRVPGCPHMFGHMMHLTYNLLCCIMFARSLALPPLLTKVHKHHVQPSIHLWDGVTSYYWPSQIACCFELVKVWSVWIYGCLMVCFKRCPFCCPFPLAACHVYPSVTTTIYCHCSAFIVVFPTPVSVLLVAMAVVNVGFCIVPKIQSSTCWSSVH